MNEDITAIDIEAYIDGELDLDRKIQVEDYLAHHPETAARVMADLRNLNVLRLLAWDPGAPWQSNQAATGLLRRFGRRPAARAISGAAMMGAFLFLIFNLPGDLPISTQQGTAIAAPPAYIDDALMSHRTARIRAAMLSQPETTAFDAADLLRATHIRVPNLPEGWHILDVQIFPSDEGPALQLAVKTDKNQSLSIFAIRAPSSAPLEPAAIRKDGESIAFWKAGSLSYALTGDVDPEELDRIAEDIEDNSVV